MSNRPAATRHGTFYAYRRGCRCRDCTAANTARCAGRRAGRAERLAADPTLVVHGSANTYSNWCCRCRPCTEAHVRRCADYHARQHARNGGPR